MSGIITALTLTFGPPFQPHSTTPTRRSYIADKRRRRWSGDRGYARRVWVRLKSDLVRRREQPSPSWLGPSQIDGCGNRHGKEHRTGRDQEREHRSAPSPEEHD
jgi:hypothetical protein